MAREQEVFVQMAAEGKRAALWGMDQESTKEAVETFVRNGLLERFLDLVATRQSWGLPENEERPGFPGA